MPPEEAWQIIDALPALDGLDYDARRFLIDRPFQAQRHDDRTRPQVHPTTWRRPVSASSATAARLAAQQSELLIMAGALRDGSFLLILYERSEFLPAGGLDFDPAIRSPTWMVLAEVIDV
jgi:hypothetical protein